MENLTLAKFGQLQEVGHSQFMKNIVILNLISMLGVSLACHTPGWGDKCFLLIIATRTLCKWVYLFTGLDYWTHL